MGDGPYQARIETAADRDRRNRYLNVKGRAFGAHLVAFTMAGGYWDFHNTDPLRPTFALFATSRQEAGPFLANLKLGRKLRIDGLGNAKEGGQPMEFLKSAGYETQVQHYVLRRTEMADDGTLSTVETPASLIEIFVRDLYEHVPSMRDPDHVKFLMSPKLEVLQRESASFGAVDLRALYKRFAKKNPYDDKAPTYDPATVAAEGRRFVASLNERTMVPILHDSEDPTFHVQLLLSALACGMAVRNAGTPYYTPSDRGFCEVGMHRAKRAPGVAFSAKQDDVAKWLADETKLFDDAR